MSQYVYMLEVRVLADDLNDARAQQEIAVGSLASDPRCSVIRVNAYTPRARDEEPAAA